MKKQNIKMKKQYFKLFSLISSLLLMLLLMFYFIPSVASLVIVQTEYFIWPKPADENKGSNRKKTIHGPVHFSQDSQSLHACLQRTRQNAQDTRYRVS